MNKSIPVSLLVVLFITSMPCFSKSPDIVDLYRFLVSKKRMRDLIEYKNGEWAVRASFDNVKIESPGRPVVDVKNGYIKIEYIFAYCNIAVEMAYFTSSGKSNYLAVTEQWECKEGKTYIHEFYQLDKNTFRDAGPGPISVTYKDFLDESAVRGIDSDIEKNASLFAINYKLPRHGTSLIVSFAGIARKYHDVSESLINRMNEFVQKNLKYREIEYSWDVKNAKFILKRKIKKAEK